jgi:hypothetical protein
VINVDKKTARAQRARRHSQPDLNNENKKSCRLAVSAQDTDHSLHITASTNHFHGFYPCHPVLAALRKP